MLNPNPNQTCLLTVCSSESRCFDGGEQAVWLTIIVNITIFRLSVCFCWTHSNEKDEKWNILKNFVKVDKTAIGQKMNVLKMNCCGSVIWGLCLVQNSGAISLLEYFQNVLNNTFYFPPNTAVHLQRFHTISSLSDSAFNAGMDCVEGFFSARSYVRNIYIYVSSSRRLFLETLEAWSSFVFICQFLISLNTCPNLHLNIAASVCGF